MPNPPGPGVLLTLLALVALRCCFGLVVGNGCNRAAHSLLIAHACVSSSAVTSSIIVGSWGFEACGTVKHALVLQPL